MALPHTLINNTIADADEVQENFDQLNKYNESPYKFRVYRNAVQSIANDSDDKVEFETEVFDPNSNFDVVTNFRYTAPITGYYLFIAAVTFDNNNTGTRKVTIKKNGNQVAIAEGDNNGASYNTAVGTSCMINMSSGDYVEVYAYQVSTAALNALGGAGVTYFHGHILSA